MAERIVEYPQNVTAGGQLVIPLDNPRSFDYVHQNISETASTSGVIFTATSGKQVWVHKVLVCEYSGVDGLIALGDPGRLSYAEAGQATPWIPVEANTCVALQMCGCPLGPFMYSGTTGYAEVKYYNDGAFYGGITIIVQTDPKMIE